MKKILSVVLVLAMLAVVAGSFSTVSAAPALQNGDSLSIVQPGGGAYIHVTKLQPGNLEFNYGWNNSNHFANPVGSYWIGVYDDSVPAYVSASGWVNVTDQSQLKLTYTETGCVSGDVIKIVFFVRTGPNGTGDSLAEFDYPPLTVGFVAP